MQRKIISFLSTTAFYLVCYVYPHHRFLVSTHKLMISRSPILTAFLLLFVSWPTKRAYD